MRVIVLLLLTSCSTTSAMLKLQAGQWRGGGIAHLAATQPSPGTAAWANWRAALDVAAHTVCTEDEAAKVAHSSACLCADGDLAAIACERFLAGQP